MSRQVLCSAVLTTSALFLPLGPAAAGGNTFTLEFDGGEPGISSGSEMFSFEGSNWEGGVVGTRGRPALYASGAFSYEFDENSGSVTFDSGVDSVEFFFVDGQGVSPGTATAFSSSDTMLGSVSSNTATTFGDPQNFETLDPAEPIARIAFSGGDVDNFTFTFEPAAEGEAEPTPEGEAEPAPVHDADQDGNGAIGLGELLAVIQLYNAGEYSCANGGPETFQPGPGNRNCPVHTADIAPEDWTIDLSELLRVIQLSTFTEIVSCPGQSEDGFCAAPM